MPDLALLRVPDLAPGPALELESAACECLIFRAFGFGAEKSGLGRLRLKGRPLTFVLGTRTWDPHPPKDPVVTWDFYLEEADAPLARVRAGYSGAPLVDEATGRVVAVITSAADDKCYARITRTRRAVLS